MVLHLTVRCERRCDLFERDSAAHVRWSEDGRDSEGEWAYFGCGN